MPIGTPKLGAVYQSAAASVSVVPVVPAATVNGDTLVMTVIADNSGAPTTPAGWTWQGGSAAGGTARIDIFTRTAANEPASYTVTVANGTQVAWITAWPGVNTTTPLDVVLVASVTTEVPQAITTVTAGAVVVGVAGARAVAGVTPVWSSTDTLMRTGRATAVTANAMGADTRDALIFRGTHQPNLSHTDNAGIPVSMTYALRPAVASIGGWPALMAEANFAGNVWTDISAYVLGVTTRRGRQYEQGTVEAGTASVALDNSDGRFTPGLVSGAYAPNILPGIPVRITATHLAVVYPLFYGRAESWASVHPGGSAYAEVEVRLVDMLAGLGRGIIPGAASAMMLDSPDYLYALQEAADATMVADLVSGGTAPVVAATYPAILNTLKFGDTAPAPLAPRVAPTWTRASATTGTTPYIRHRSPPYPVGSAQSIEQWVFLNSGAGFPADSLYSYLGISAINEAQQISLSRQAGFTYFEASTAGANVGAPTSVALGAWHQLVAICQPGQTLKFYADGVLVGTSLTTSFAWTTEAIDEWIGQSWHGQIALTARYAFALSAAQVAAHYAGSQGNSNDMPGTRLARILSYAKYAGAKLLDVGDTALLPYTDPIGSATLALLRDVETTDGGLLYAGPDGTLRYENRRTRLNPANTATFAPAAATGVELDLMWSIDDTRIVNDSAVTISGGPTIRTQDAASAAKFGWVSESLTIAAADPEQAAYRGQVAVARGKTPLTRASKLSLNPAASAGDALWPLALAVDLGEGVTVAGLPSTAPAASMALIAESVSHTISGNRQWRVEVDASPASLQTGMQLDLATRDELNGTNTVLAW